MYAPPVHFSLELPTTRVDRPAEFVSAEAITELTRAAAEAGFSAVNVTDHPAPDAKWLDHGGHQALDPLVALSFDAAADPAIRLHTNIWVAAYRNPFLGAKGIHSLQVLSGGRVILGTAAGYLKPEFGALGVDFDRRGEALDEALEVLAAVFGGGDIALRSDRSRARGVRFEPTGGDIAAPPVWVGGNSRAALRRAAHHDGWSPFHTSGFAQASRTAPLESADDLAAAIKALLAEREALGRSGDFDVCWSAAGTARDDLGADERCDDIGALADAGVTWLTVSPTAAHRTELVDWIHRFGAEVISRTGPLR